METVGVFIFFAGIAATFAFGVVGWMHKIEARRITASQGLEVPLVLRANMAIDTRMLDGEAIAPAIRSNRANGYALLFMAIGVWGSFLADPTIVSAVFAALFSLGTAVGSMRLLRSSTSVG